MPRSAQRVMWWLDAASDGEGVVPAYQPIVALSNDRIVGFEALARWPDFDASPEAVFERATARGTLDTLDARCIHAALVGALRDELQPGALLLVNCEPTSHYVGPENDEFLARGRELYRIAFEFTERGLLAHPRELLRKLAAARADGFLVALDDVGANPDSLALLDVVCPDIIKLDLAMVQANPTRDQARTLSAVLAHRERTGAVILAEGIETDEHLERALAVGATLGQGILFGQAATLRGDGAAIPWSEPLQDRVIRVECRSPFEIVERSCPVRTSRKSTLAALSQHLESQAQHSADPPMLMTALQRVCHFTADTRQRYRRLGGRLPLVAVFGEEVPEELGPGVRGVRLDSSDPLCREWAVVMLGPHTAGALVAREQGDDHRLTEAPDDERRFELAITHDRGLVTRCARSLLERMR
jgi:EAL domain-containing protein (putative c-di-GMP-specific phosphodiesterase class I)